MDILSHIAKQSGKSAHSRQNGNVYVVRTKRRAQQRIVSIRHEQSCVLLVRQEHGIDDYTFTSRASQEYFADRSTVDGFYDAIRDGLKALGIVTNSWSVTE